MANLFPANDEQFITGLGNFITVANANLVTLGLVAGDITTLTADKTDLDTKIAGSKSAREAMRGATTAKKISRRTGNTDLRAVIKKVEATPGVPENLLDQLGLSIRDTKPTPVQPHRPIDLVVEGLETGINKLRWNRNGNKSGTMYIIEARVDDTGEFKFVNATTRPDFEHMGQTPGQKIAYRVKAKRPAGESPYSNVAVVYDLELPLAA